ncbi:hypothetical protein CYMTET_41039 [Cymbomonas tetramitiformis]|uniref:Uncharacterized protein n=1 Tax=Cymbomonas tetramitiformis TaxID=36881 RepID=A0AAE0F2M8_9CHLO|nr:hypothetical protein CYMTET_41039 [Cymbomonas tetramitiformis]
MPTANELLYSVLLLLTAPGSPARNWVEASGADVPADGKRATLEVVRMLADDSTPFESLTELLEVRISDESDPDSSIRLFNSCLRDAQRLQTLPEDAVKRQFLSALSGPAYATLVDSFARADQRAAVSLLTLQARVREQYRCGRLSGKRTAGRPMSVASCTTDTGLASAIERLSSQLVKLQRDVDSLKKGGSKPPHGKHAPRGFHRPGVQPLAHSASSEVAFDRRSGTFVPTCRHEKCRAVGSKHWLSECPHKDTHPMTISASYCQAVESYDSDVLALRFQRYYDAGDEGSMEHLCALVGQPEICELSAHSFAPEPTALQQFKDVAASAESAPAEHLSIGRVPFAEVSGPLAGGVAEPTASKQLLPKASVPVHGGTIGLHEVSSAAFVPPSASLALGPMASADNSFKTFNTIHPDWLDIDPEPVEVCDSDDDGEGSNYPPGVCLTEIEGGAPPTAAAFRRFGVPRGSRPFGIGEFTLSLFMVATFLFSATAMPTLVVSGGVRGLVEPGATYDHGAVHLGGALLDSPCPTVVTAEDAEGIEHVSVTGEECMAATAKLIGAIKSGITEECVSSFVWHLVFYELYCPVVDATSTSVVELEGQLREEADIAAKAQAENLSDLDLHGKDERVEDVEEQAELGASEGEGGDDWEDAADRGDFDNSDFLTSSEGNGSRLLSHEETAEFDESTLRAALAYTQNVSERSESIEGHEGDLPNEDFLQTLNITREDLSDATVFEEEVIKEARRQITNHLLRLHLDVAALAVSGVAREDSAQPPFILVLLKTEKRGSSIAGSRSARH